MGPLFTLIVFNTTKRRDELVRDVAIIAFLQLAALGYGLHTVFIARLVLLVYQVDRFRALSQLDVDESTLPQALPEFRSFSIAGPKLAGTRRPRNVEERLQAIDMGLQGVDIGQRRVFGSHMLSCGQTWFNGPGRCLF